jgi:hypothetical protein
MEGSLKMKKPVEPASAKRVALALAVFLSPAAAGYQSPLGGGGARKLKCSNRRQSQA